MSGQKAEEGIVRRLWPTETDKFRDHLLRLDRESRRMRFAQSVSDPFIAEYAGRMSEFGRLVFGHVVDGKVRGVAELRRLGDTWGDEAEAAFSVEKAYQDQGVGTQLMGRVVRAARNRRIRRLYVSCLAENARMRAIARKHEAVLRLEYGKTACTVRRAGWVKAHPDPYPISPVERRITLRSQERHENTV